MLLATIWINTVNFNKIVNNASLTHLRIKEKNHERVAV